MKRNIKTPKLRNKIAYKDQKIGLHCHCEEKPEALIQLLKLARQENAKFIAITNHKSLKIYTQVLEQMQDEILKQYSDIKLIPSVEMEASFKFTDLDGKTYGIPVHILGYGLNVRKEELLDKFVEKKYHELDQVEELKRLISIGHELGLDFKEENAYIDSKDGNRRFAGRAFMQAVMENMEANFNEEGEDDTRKLPSELRENSGAFYNRCVKDIKSPFYLDLTSVNPSAEEVIDLIHQMGGKAYLAHPSAYFAKNGSREQIQKVYDNIVEFVRQFMEKYSLGNTPNCTIDGIEMYHPSYIKNDMQLLGKMKPLIELYRLGTSGGTDVHIGSIKTNRKSVIDDSKGGKIAIRKLKRFSQLKKEAKGLKQIKDIVRSLKEKENEKEDGILDI